MSQQHDMNKSGEPVVTSLRAVFRAGQTFLTWNEAPTPDGSSFNVYHHDEPITSETIAAARLIAHHIEPHSARDPWADPASFNQSEPVTPAEPIAYPLSEFVHPLDPSMGLFVNTVEPAGQGCRYYAVTWTDPTGHEDRTVTPGVNALAERVKRCQDDFCGAPFGPITENHPDTFSPIEPIWIGDGAMPQAGSGSGRRLVLKLHGRGQGRTAGPSTLPVNCLAFGDESMGWRRGLSFKFQLEIDGEAVVIRPSDRVWVNRPLLESDDPRDHAPMVNTWWYGYNAHIYDPKRCQDDFCPPRRTPSGPLAENHPDTFSHVRNYTERRLLWLIEWARRYLGTDPERTFLDGGSMGGSGAISMALHHPDVFAAVHARVPIVAYTRPGEGSAKRLEPYCGRLDGVERCQDAICGAPSGPVTEKHPDTFSRSVLEHMNGTLQVEKSTRELPFMFLCHGRTDGSIPWENNPAFYRALGRMRRGCAIYWNARGHGDCYPSLPDDARVWESRLFQLRRDESYPAFTNCSSDRDPGDGDPANGDPEGWVNRGLHWSDVVDEPDRYEITLKLILPDTKPLTADVTPRRTQRFKPRPGEIIRAWADGVALPDIEVDAMGLCTAGQVAIGSAGVRLRLTRSAGPR